MILEDREVIPWADLKETGWLLLDLSIDSQLGGYWLTSDISSYVLGTVEEAF